MKILGKRETVVCKIDNETKYKHNKLFNSQVLIKNIRLNSTENLEECRLFCNGNLLDTVSRFFFDYLRRENSIEDDTTIPFNLTHKDGMLIGKKSNFELNFGFTDYVKDLILTYDVYDVSVEKNKLYEKPCKQLSLSGYYSFNPIQKRIFVYGDRTKTVALYSPGVKFNSSYATKYSFTKSDQMKEGKIVLSYVEGENYVYKIIDNNNNVIKPTCFYDLYIMFDDDDYDVLKDKHIYVGTYHENIYCCQDEQCGMRYQS